MSLQTLLALKAEYKKLTGNDVPQAGRGGGGKKEGKKPKAEGGEKKSKETKPKQASGAKDKKETKNVKGETKLKVDAKKNEDLPSWYTQTIVKAEMIEYYDISGCYILRPAAFCIWDYIKEFFDGEIKKLGVENSYFPMFVPQKALELEKDHIEDFAPEVLNGVCTCGTLFLFVACSTRLSLGMGPHGDCDFALVFCCVAAGCMGDTLGKFGAGGTDCNPSDE